MGQKIRSCIQRYDKVTPKKGPKKDVDASKAIDACVRRISGPSDREFIRSTLEGLVRNNVIPVALLDVLPVPPARAGRTRFDQLYEAAMSLVFPEYRENTIARLLGPDPPEQGIKIWRAIFPEKYMLTHVLLRAHTYQEAFSLACDYACRLSLHMFNRVPVDLTVRVMFMSEGALRRHLTLREVNRKKKRRDLQLEARDYTDKQLNGARIAALGPPRDPSHTVFRYSEKKDLRRIKEAGGPARTSAVQSESHKPSVRKPMREPL